MIYSFMQPQVISQRWQPFLLDSTPLHWQKEAILNGRKFLGQHGHNVIPAHVWLKYTCTTV